MSFITHFTLALCTEVERLWGLRGQSHIIQGVLHLLLLGRRSQQAIYSTGTRAISLLAYKTDFSHELVGCSHVTLFGWTISFSFF